MLFISTNWFAIIMCSQGCSKPKNTSVCVVRDVLFGRPWLNISNLVGIPLLSNPVDTPQTVFDINLKPTHQ